ncbi:SIS domain-containing protein [Nonomuraea sp. LP-02]|uniref:SIS domain-containing protein n=1 Tax=Nonomuraea sp. LP-02 TaxID=3097960 RepID=UPI002E376B44|nr:SIS domain-containing protein [Nonomuraea sp. LP-02]MED7928792.1 SIS domain-containing protein [Nonomuraea sp. LP-02]
MTEPCHDEVCVTCSDTAVPMRVLRLLEDGLALVETESGPEEVSVALVDVRPGDVVLVHAKEAIAIGLRGGESGIEALYPFLAPAPADREAVVADLCASTRRKADEIVALRRSLVALHAERLMACARAMAAAFDAGGRLFAFGNGGSSTDAQAVAQLFAAPPEPARAVAAVPLAQDVALLTALSNDVGYELVFARQLAALGRRGDVAVGLSTSGGSANVLNAMAAASRRGMLTVGLVGYDGGPMAQEDRVAHLFVVPSASVHRIQEAQITLCHVLWELTQRVLTGET